MINLSPIRTSKGPTMKYEYDGPRTSVVLTYGFDAWLGPETASKWLFTTKMSTSEARIDARVHDHAAAVRLRDVDCVWLDQDFRPARKGAVVGRHAIAADCNWVHRDDTRRSAGLEAKRRTHTGMNP